MLEGKRETGSDQHHNEEAELHHEDADDKS